MTLESKRKSIAFDSALILCNLCEKFVNSGHNLYKEQLHLNDNSLDFIITINKMAEDTGSQIYNHKHQPHPSCYSCGQYVASYVIIHYLFLL